ncbi:MAG: acyl-CoA oxidase, partial [Flavobacterium sp.]
MKNTKLQAFIPFFYIVWSDDLLTQKEFTTLEKFIYLQDWLSAEEKQFLVMQIDISNPPARQNITDWKNTIEQIIEENPSIKSIFDIALTLSENNASIQNSEIAFIKLENDLGILGEEAIGNFKT